MLEQDVPEGVARSAKSCGSMDVPEGRRLESWKVGARIPVNQIWAEKFISACEEIVSGNQELPEDYVERPIKPCRDKGDSRTCHPFAEIESRSFEMHRTRRVYRPNRPV